MLQKFKVVMVGDLAVGKTSIAGRLLGNDFESSYRATVGATFLSLERTIQNVQCIINLWDTAGQENFRSLLSMYARETQGALIVCDVTREDTFNHIKDWIDFIKDATPSAQLVLLANKIDLVSERVVTPEKLQSFANANSIKYFETSALQGIGYNEAFESLCDDLFLIEKDQNTLEEKDLNSQKDKKTSSCC